MNEQWNPIPNYEGYYEVSSLGGVRSVDREIIGRWGAIAKKGKIMSLGTDTGGYRFAHLSKNSKSETLGVHRMVALSFLGEKPEGLVVDHIDGNRGNNRVENLQYITQRENCIKGRLSMGKAGKLSRFTGVTYDKARGKWKAQVRKDGKQIHLGRFENEDVAFEAYLNATT